MVADIDDKLRALGQLPDHPAGLAVGALLIGAVGATVPSRQAVASTPVTFADPGPLAPSSLLLGSGER